MDSQVQEIKDKVSINDVVGQYVKLKKSRTQFQWFVPFHKERTPSFMVSPERGTYICFGCGRKATYFPLCSGWRAWISYGSQTAGRARWGQTTKTIYQKS